MHLSVLRRSLLCICLFIAIAPLFAQEQLGMRLERYAGIYGASINPAAMAFNPNRWEVSLFSADAFLANNYLFLQNTSLPKILRNSDQIRSARDFRPERPPPADVILADFFTAARRMHGAAQARLSGPGFSVRMGENHVFGLSTALRTGFSMYKIPAVLRYDRIGFLLQGETVRIAPTGPTAAAWGEVALHYSHRNTDGAMVVAWGITPKLLLGLEGGFGRIEGAFDYTPLAGDTGAFASAKWDYGLTLNNISALEQAESIKPQVNGYGAGLDMGISWAMPAEDSDAPEDYQWRAGASLLDVGFIHFNRGAERHHIEFNTTVTLSADDLDADKVQGYVADASRIFLGDSTRSLQAQTFNIGMPTALSLQFDYRVTPRFYIGGLLIQRVPFSKYSLQRPNTLAAVPRFEHRWFSLSLPVVLNDWQSLRVGLAARLGFLVLGSDHLRSFFTQNKFTGTDFYIGLKINSFSIRSGEKGGRAGKQRGSRRNVKGVKCYDF